jgi:hypothetical protein
LGGLEKRLPGLSPSAFASAALCGFPVGFLPLWGTRLSVLAAPAVGMGLRPLAQRFACACTHVLAH